MRKPPLRFDAPNRALDTQSLPYVTPCIYMRSKYTRLNSDFGIIQILHIFESILGQILLNELYLTYPKVPKPKQHYYMRQFL